MSSPTRRGCIPTNIPASSARPAGATRSASCRGRSGCTTATAPSSRRRLPAMVKWVDFVWSISDGPIVRPPRAWGARGFTFGDWLQPKGPSEKPCPTIGDDAAATIYLYISSELTAKVAARARRHGDRQAHERSRRSGEAGLRHTSSSRRPAASPMTTRPPMRWPSSTTSSRPTCCRRPRSYFKATIARADGRIGTGFIGTPALLPALREDRRAAARGRGLPAGGGAGLALPGQERRDHDLGALGRHPARTARSSSRR